MDLLFFLAYNYLSKTYVVEKSHMVIKDKLYIGTWFMNLDFNC